MRSFLFRKMPFLWIALFLLAPLCHAAGPQWVEVRSTHFTVLTDDGEKSGRNVALRFEQMRAAFAVLYPNVKVRVNVPLQIIAFRKTKEMREVGPVFQGKPVEVAGYYQRGPGTAYIALDLSTEDSWQTVFHEYGHQL